MQLNGANLLIAAQQAARQAPQAQPNAKAFASALSEHTGGDSFAPLDFKQTAAAPAPASRPAQNQNPAQKLGGTLDIRI